jgi:hypothetical protein
VRERSPSLLCEIGVLREVKAWREKLFIHPNLMKLLTAEDHKVRAYRRCDISANVGTGVGGDGGGEAFAECRFGSDVRFHLTLMLL